MEGRASRFAAGLSAAVMLCVGAPAWSQDGVPIKGVIIRHQGSTIVVRADGGDKTVNLTEATKIRGSAGSLGVRTSEKPASDLIRGLHVQVLAVTTGSGIEATRVDFKNSDLKTARSVAGGLVATDEQVAINAAGIAENSGRIDNIGLLEPAGRTKVYFAVGSTTLTEKSKQDLQGIAAQAKSMKGAYRLAVVGRADPTGNAKANQRLSEARAAAVTAYLMQTQGILPGNFLPQAALGDNPVAQDPDPPKNAAEARRVTVTIGVSKSNRTASAP